MKCINDLQVSIASELFSIIRFIVLIIATIGLIMSCGTPKASKIAAIKTDNKAPVFIYFPENIIDTCGNNADFGMPEVQDDSGKFHLTFIDDQQGDCLKGMHITRIWSAVDASGNQTTRNQIIQLLPQKEAQAYPVYDDRLHVILNKKEEKVRLKIFMPSEKKVTASISDLDGKIWFELEKTFLKGPQHEMVDVSHFPKGTYFVMFRYDGKWLSNSFLKK